MDIEEFVKQTIEQVVRGVKGSHEVAKKHGATIGASRKAHQSIEFDVAVTVTEGGETSTGGGIKVAWVSLGASGKDERSSSSVSRVKYDVPISYPTSHAISDAPVVGGFRTG